MEIRTVRRDAFFSFITTLTCGAIVGAMLMLGWLLNDADIVFLKIFLKELAQ